MLATAGAIWFGKTGTAQFLGAMAGLGVGLVCSVVVAKLLRRGRKEGP